MLFRSLTPAETSNQDRRVAALAACGKSGGSTRRNLGGMGEEETSANDDVEDMEAADAESETPHA